MQLKLSPQHKVIIRPKQRHLTNPDYIRDREKYWNQILETARRNNQKIWNGRVYCLEDILQVEGNHLLITLSAAEYKDIVFNQKFGALEIITKYGKENLTRHISCDVVLLTTDNKYVFGVRDNSSALMPQGSLGIIGGTLNQDELQVDSFEDFYKFIIMEIKEETSLQPTRDQLNLHSINNYNTKYQFLFELKLAINSEELNQIKIKEEFSELIALDRDELTKYTGPILNSVKHFMEFH